MSSKDSKGGSLDLGLTAILSGESSAPPSLPIDPHISPPPVEPATDEFEEFAIKGDWSGLAQYTEGRLSVDGDKDIDGRLWWIYAQKRLGNLPDILLRAPLEAALVAAQDPSVTESSRHLAEKVRLFFESPTSVEGRVNPPQLVSSPRLQNAPEFPPKVTPPSYSYPRSGAGRLRSFAVGAVSFIFLIFILWQAGLIFGGPIAIAPVRVEPSGDIPVQLAAAFVPRGGVGNLGAIYYDMSAVAVQPTPPGEVQPPPPVEPAAKVVEKVSLPASPKKKEKLNMGGPVEPPELRNRVNAGFGRSDGTRFEAPVRTIPNDSNSTRDQPRIEAGGVFSMLVRSNVLSEPSPYGRVIARLEASDRIRIEAYMGRWVKIVGSRGRPGYVLTQDIGSRVR